MTYKHGCLLLPLCLTMLGCERAPTVDHYATGAFIEDGLRSIEKAPDEVTEQARKYFSDWLKDHGEENVINDDGGVGVAETETRLWAFLYGDSEIEFRIVLPDDREIVEFVAGMGEDREKATAGAMVNFCLSTLHVAYSCFMNEDDPHMDHEEIMIAGKPFTLTSGGIVAFGGEELPKFDGVSAKVHAVLANSSINLENKPHWLKIVYGQMKGEMILASVTLDNDTNDLLTSRVAELAWPESKDFYMAKEFLVLRPRK
ncbi:MAG: DUF6348 family protein [Planctomycetota bacterium]